MRRSERGLSARPSSHSASDPDSLSPVSRMPRHPVSVATTRYAVYHTTSYVQTLSITRIVIHKIGASARILSFGGSSVFCIPAESIDGLLRYGPHFCAGEGYTGVTLMGAVWEGKREGGGVSTLQTPDFTSIRANSGALEHCFLSIWPSHG
jgi:hypothetical protein